MASVVITIKIMPESPETDLKEIEKSSKEHIKSFTGETEIRVEEENIAFGLIALKITFVMNESKGNIDPLEDQLRNIDGVNSVEVIDVRRTIG